MKVDIKEESYYAYEFDLFCPLKFNLSEQCIGVIEKFFVEKNPMKL